MMDPKSMPFDMKRMAYGGFRTHRRYVRLRSPRAFLRASCSVRGAPRPSRTGSRRPVRCRGQEDDVVGDGLREVEARLGADGSRSARAAHNRRASDRRARSCRDGRRPRARRESCTRRKTCTPGSAAALRAPGGTTSAKSNRSSATVLVGFRHAQRRRDERARHLLLCRIAAERAGHRHVERKAIPVAPQAGIRRDSSTSTARHPSRTCSGRWF